MKIGVFTDLGYNVNMIDLKNQNVSRQDNLDQAMELLYFGYRAFIAEPDRQLAKLGLSRVHHRILYFIARHPQSSVNELLAIMRVTKQYLHQPLRRLIQEGYVTARKDRQDARVKRLQLSRKGAGMEKSLSQSQRELLQQCFEAAAPDGENGWKQVMQRLVRDYPGTDI